MQRKAFGTERKREGMAFDKREAEKQKKIGRLAEQVLSLARDSIVVNMRFIDAALAGLLPVPGGRIGCVYHDGSHLYYDPVFLLKKYQEEPAFVVHMYLHMLFHCIFYHSFQYGKLEKEYWDLSVDIAAEATVLELMMNAAEMKADRQRKEKLQILKKNVKGLTAEKIYRYFQINPLSADGLKEWTALFKMDEHAYWTPREELVVTREQWKKISERIKTDLKSFSRDKNNSESLEKNLEEATKERYDYGAILRRFQVMGEEPCVNEDEFDYIYYTYGLARYGNMPLIEPLEYKELKKVREFVIVLDTSASCRGETVQAFLRKTYSILKEEENFFHKINVHILQCDNEIQSDTKITCDADFETFLKHGKLKGFGGTDFRPAFTYVDSLIDEGEFENLKGLIYFTDGLGIYPERMPEYHTIFAFLEDDFAERMQPQVPPWAIKVVLEEEDLESAEKPGRNGEKDEH